MSDRPLRICDECGQVDDHPRHVIGLDLLPEDQRPEVRLENVTRVVESDIPTAEKVRIIDEIHDTSVLQRHMDCCAAAGCPDGTCDAIAKTHKGLTGSRLVKHLTSGAATKEA